MSPLGLAGRSCKITLFLLLLLLPELILFLHVCKDSFMPAICEILRFHVGRLDTGQAPLTWTMAADNVLWIFSACKGQWPFLIHLPVSLLPCNSQISHWLLFAGSSAYVRNFSCIWCELRLMNSVTWKLSLKIGEVGNGLPSSSGLLKALSGTQFMVPHWNAKFSAARTGWVSEALKSMHVF